MCSRIKIPNQQQQKQRQKQNKKKCAQTIWYKNSFDVWENGCVQKRIHRKAAQYKAGIKTHFT